MASPIIGKYCTLNYSELPHFEARAVQLSKYFDDKYPQILRLVGLPLRESVNIIMKTLPEDKAPASKYGHNNIAFDPNRINSKDKGFLIHEGTHVAQDFDNNNFRDSNNRWWLIEGMADYVRLLLGWDSPDPYKFEPSMINKSCGLQGQCYVVWTELFKWLSKKYSRGNLLVDFTHTLKQGGVDEDFLEMIFGYRSLELWQEYEKQF